MSPGKPEPLICCITDLLNYWREACRMRLAVVNLKGGTGKTTSATALAMSLSARGRTLLVDADPQGSALAWSEEAAFPFPTIGLPVRDLHVRLLQLGADYDHIVIDTPPGVPRIVRS